MSLPGRIDMSSQKLVFAPNLGWTDVDLKTPLEKATGLPVELENAANACALAEVWFGRYTEGMHNLVALTVSEGIGGGLILNGQIVRGPTGAAGEFGHVTIVEQGLECRAAIAAVGKFMPPIRRRCAITLRRPRVSATGKPLTNCLTNWRSRR